MPELILNIPITEPLFTTTKSILPQQEIQEISLNANTNGLDEYFTNLYIADLWILAKVKKFKTA